MSKRKNRRKVVKEEPQSPSRRKFLLLGGAVVAGAGLGVLFRSKATVPRVETPKEYEPLSPIVVGSNNKRIRVIFQFGRHKTQQDALKIEPLLEKFKPHVFCMENAGSTEANARAGEEFFLKGQLRGGDPFTAGIQQILRKHVDRVFTIEKLPEKDADWIRHNSIVREKKRKAAIREFLAGQSESAVEQYRQFIELGVREDKTREEIIKSTLSNFHDLLLRRFPELEKENEIRVVVYYGATHTPIYRHAKSSGFAEVKREMEKPYYFALRSAIIRGATFSRLARDRATGARTRIWPPRRDSNEDIARALLGEVLGKHASAQGVSYLNGSVFGNLFAKKVSLEQFHRISTNVGKFSGNYGAIGPPLQTALEVEKMSLPMSKEEVHRFLRNQKIPLAGDEK